MKKIFKLIAINLLIIILLSVITSSYSLADQLASPWESPQKSAFTKIIEDSLIRKSANDSHSYKTSTVGAPFLWGLLFYQKFISPVDGDKCGMYPTCSGYSALAIRKHGAIVGIMMTVDRLLHEGDEAGKVPLIEKYGVVRFYDPIENNDFWFTDEN